MNFSISQFLGFTDEEILSLCQDIQNFNLVEDESTFANAQKAQELVQIQ